MKHLKSYKLFESWRDDSIKQDIKDIFWSEVDSDDFILSDASLRVEPGSFAFKIQKQVDKTFPVVNAFQVRELKSFIERVLNYSDRNPCEIQVYIPLPLGVEYIEKKDIKEIDSNLGFFHDYGTHTLMIKVRAFE